ncbi:hypothetical protein CBM2605_A60401 [Cupriavidus neocaledonicus]|uniref:Uncharacterized protein n=1 Tax=Cupriavidus neocaledonicus TaxID=1040979 RepID=A0ABY1V384_9BURK|nr:hypothetical protein CBM2605_A60401 [Cupriavidus neocaledonicus]
MPNSTRCTTATAAARGWRQGCATGCWAAEVPTPPTHRRLTPSLHRERAGVRGGLAGHHLKQRPRFPPTDISRRPSRPVPGLSPARRERGANRRQSTRLRTPQSAGLHLERRSDSRTAFWPANPVSRTVRRHHIIFPFVFNSLHASRGTFALARRVQYRPPLTAPDRYAGTPPVSRPMPKKQRRTHP